MDSRYSQALRGIRADGSMGDFLKEATGVLSEDELRALVGSANYELEKYKKFQTRYYQYGGSTLFMKDMVGKRLIDLTDEQIDGAIMRKYTLSKTMVKALKRERKRRKKQ